MGDETNTSLLISTSDIVSAHVANNRVQAADLPGLIATVYAALSTLGDVVPMAEPEKPQGAVTARKSLANPAHILSMIDGKPYQTLRRHIGKHGHTPESYREAYNLPHDYPMTSAAYTETRRALAHKIGLGRTQQQAAPEPQVAPKRGRKPKALGDAIKAAKGHLGGK